MKDMGEKVVEVDDERFILLGTNCWEPFASLSRHHLSSLPRSGTSSSTTQFALLNFVRVGGATKAESVASLGFVI